MRTLLLFACCALLAAADLSELHRLDEANRAFELRRALQAPGGPSADTLYYRGVTASRFGRETEGVGLLRAFVADQPKPEMERKAREEMAWALVRMTRYGDAAREFAEALRLMPPNDDRRADIENSRVLYDSLSDVAPIGADFGPEMPVEATRNGLGSLDVPVQVNGRSGKWILDTGADFSTVTESEAKRLGLSVRESKAYVTGSTDQRNALRLAVADDLRFGPAHVRHVVLLVVSDSALYVGPLKYQITGILGIPVLRALGRIAVSAKGAITIHPNSPAADGEPNVFFEESSPVAEAGHAGHHLQMFVDTGANTSFLYPSARVMFTPDELSKLEAKSVKTGGAGGIVTRQTMTVPTLQLELMGRGLELSKTSLLMESPKGSTRDGVLGMDAFTSGFVLDFPSMQLQIP